MIPLSTMTKLAQLNDCHSCNDARSIVQKKSFFVTKFALLPTYIIMMTMMTVMMMMMLMMMLMFLMLMLMMLGGRFDKVVRAYGHA